MKQTILAMLIVTALAGGSGAFFGLKIAATPPPHAEAETHAAEAAPAPVTVPADSSLFDLSPIVTNLGAPQDTWIRLEASIVFDPKALPHPEAVAGKIGEDLLAYLRTVSLKQLEGPVGLQSIREDLNDRAAVRSEGKVRELIIRTLVVQ